MKYNMRALEAEILKLKRTTILWSSLVTPLVIVLFMFFGVILKFSSNSGTNITTNAWVWFTNLIFSFWALLMLPLYIVLETALLGQLEHSEKLWKHLYVLPIPRSSLYESKLIIGSSLVIVSNIILGISTILAGMSLSYIRPNLGFKGNIPFINISQFLLLSFIASFMIIAIQIWLSLRWQNVTISIGIGMIATVIGQFLAQSSNWTRIFPWSFPGLILSGDSSITNQIIIISIIGGTFFAIFGCWDKIRLDVT